MISPVLRSLLWKEYRQQRGFWLAMLLFSVLLQMLPLLVSAVNGTSFEPFWLFTAALGVPALYALGCGATAFAGEHEAETYAFQQALPVSPGQLVCGKLSFALITSLVLPLLLWPVACALAQGKLPPPRDHFLLWCGSYVILFELLAWGLFWSLLCPRPIWAVVLAATSAIVTGFVAIPYLWTALGGAFLDGTSEYLRILPWRLLMAVLLLGLDAALGRRWLGLYPWVPRNTTVRPSGPTEVVHRRRGGPGALGAFKRLLWHEWRQSWVTLATVYGLFLLVIVWTVAMELPYSQPPSWPERLVAGLFLAPLLGTLLGSLTFSGDQRKNQFRFFAEHGVSARLVWLTRQFVWLTAVGVWWLVLGPVATGRGLDDPVLEATTLFGGGQTVPPEWPWLTQRIALLGLTVLGYAAGQTCSLFLRSGILAFFCGLMFSALVGAWASLMVWLRVPLWFSVATIPVILGWVTWLRAPDWVAEKTTRRARLRALASLLLPALVLFAAVIAFRVWEIPGVRIVFPPVADAPASEEERSTAELYREAARLLAAAKTNPDVAEQQTQRDTGLAKFLEASHRPECRFSPAQFGSDRWPFDAALDIQAHAEALEAEGQTDQALELEFALLLLARRRQSVGSLPAWFLGDAIDAGVCDKLWFWATRDGRSPDELREVIRRFECEPTRPPLRLGADEPSIYDSLRASIFDPDPVWRERLGASAVTTWWWSMRLFPWEAARTDRLIRVCLAPRQQYPNIERALREGWPDDGFPSTSSEALTDRWQATTPLARILTGGPLPARALAEQVFWMETRRRVFPVRLALAAYRLEHGRLPERLDELVGDYLRELPLDPYANAPIVYQPQGYEEPLVRSQFPGQDRVGNIVSMAPAEKILAPGTPFLWVTGPDLRLKAEFWHVRGQPIDLPSYNWYFRLPRTAQANIVARCYLESQADLWRTGWVLALTPAVPAAEARGQTP